MAALIDHSGDFSTLADSRAEAQFSQWAIALICLFMLLDLKNRPIDSQYLTSHPAPVHRAMYLTGALSRTYSERFGWSDEYRIDLHDDAWATASRLAVLLGMPEGRWHGEHILGMDHDLFIAKNEEFITFSQQLDAINARK